MNTPPPGRLLLVDDTPANLALLIDALSDSGHEVLVAENGRSALAVLDHTTPDLVLMDVVMPGWDGIETCRRLKARPECRDLPVIFMTAVGDTPERLRAFEAGGVDYITKPLYAPEVLARVSAHLQIRALRQSLAEELALRAEAEEQLSQSLDRAVVIATAAGEIVFATRLAEDLLHKHHAERVPGRLPMTFSPDLVVQRFANPGRGDLSCLLLEERGAPPGPGALRALGLTPREAEVLYWIAQGKSNPDIAAILGANVRTVHKHVEHIFQKLGLETRNAAMLAALEVLRPPRT